VAILELLLAHGADTRAKDREGRSASLLAKYTRSFPSLKAALQKVDNLLRIISNQPHQPKVKRDKHWKAFCKAVSKGHRSKVERLLKTSKTVKQQINSTTRKGHR